MTGIPLPEAADRLRSALLDWYRAHRRDLPWRRTADPYAVWVSEIMLQQTRVETVIPCYMAWLRRFPTVGALAAAPIDDVLRAWEGLGYYRRARNLHRAARIVMEEHGGELPSRAEALAALPGIGESTAGALASIAFGAREPVLDANVKRILCRLCLVEGRPDRSRTLRNLWETARELLPDRGAGEHNQALMDLGATVCLPRRPACEACPFGEACLARRQGARERLPEKPARKVLPHCEVVVGLFREGDRLLIRRRADDAMLGGLWEFPGGRPALGETPAECLQRTAGAWMGMEVLDATPLASVKHAYSHFRITMEVFGCRHGERPIEDPPDARWATVGEMDRLAFDGASRKIIRCCTGDEPGAVRDTNPVLYGTRTRCCTGHEPDSQGESGSCP